MSRLSRLALHDMTPWELIPLTSQTRPSLPSNSASAPIPLLIQVNINRIRKVPTILLTLLLRQRIPGNDLERLLDINTLLRTRFKIRHLPSTLTIRMGSLLGNHPPVLAHVDLVPQHHEREGFRVAWRGLNQKLVAPAVEGLEGLGAVDVVDQHAAVGAAVEGDAERLEAFLARGVPELEGHDAVVDRDFFGQEVRADGGFVGGGEFLVYLF